jgi:hypothetical protein
MPDGPFVQRSPGTSPCPPWRSRAHPWYGRCWSHPYRCEPWKPRNTRFRLDGMTAMLSSKDARAVPEPRSIRSGGKARASPSLFEPRAGTDRQSDAEHRAHGQGTARRGVRSTDALDEHVPARGKVATGSCRSSGATAAACPAFVATATAGGPATQAASSSWHPLPTRLAAAGRLVQHL